MRIAILSTSRLPSFLGEQHPNEEPLFAEDDLLIDELKRLGARAKRVSWRDEDIPWGAFDLVVIRSTWDYIDDLPKYLKTLQHITEQGARLVNPRKTVNWNHDKRYLRSFAKKGIPVVPALYIDSGEGVPGAFPGWACDHSRFILKPTVGVGGYGVCLFDSAKDLSRALADRDPSMPMMIQPFVESIRNSGEVSFVFGGGDFLYAALKTPAAGDFRVQVMYGASTVEFTPTASELTIAQQVIEAAPVPVELARIDMARLEDGQLVLMEAELIEPQLYLHDVAGAAEKLAKAIVSIATQ